jgi:hypothetical protein
VTSKLASLDIVEWLTAQFLRCQLGPHQFARCAVITTANADDILLVHELPNGGSDTAASGWTLINGNNFNAAAAKVVTSTQSFLPTTAFTTGAISASICDGFIKRP